MVGRGNDSWSSWSNDGEQGESPGDGGVKVLPHDLLLRPLLTGSQFTASTAHLRGLIHLHLGASDLAKEAFMEALSRDVKCFESFEVLVGGEMMSSEEGSLGLRVLGPR